MCERERVCVYVRERERESVTAGVEASPKDAHTVLCSTCSQEPVQTVGRAHRGHTCRAGAAARSRGARGAQEEGVGAPLSPAPVAKDWWGVGSS